MSDKLVSHLRQISDAMKSSPMRGVDFVGQAADRIEQLEAALREIVDRAEHRMGHAVSDDVCVIARKALEGKDG
jgi:hypothetical protein